MGSQHNQYRELGKGLQVLECGYERHKEFERFLQDRGKAMNIQIRVDEGGIAGRRAVPADR